MIKPYYLYLSNLSVKISKDDHNLILSNFIENKVLKQLKIIDLYGVRPLEKKHKSTMGGIITLLVYTLSMCYFGYSLIENYSKTPIPKVTSSK